ncbi:MAG: hypothetical protein J1F64_07505 [Oscillospiraceae bacterium]|nr:hypothetical protein [Oscillospiraceae bacterium]
MAEKNRTRKKGTLKKVTAVIISVIIVLSLSAAGMYQFYFKPKYADKIIEAADKILENKEVQELLESEEVKKILESSEIKDLLENDKPEQSQIQNILENEDVKNIIDSQTNTSQPANTEQSAGSDRNYPPPDAGSVVIPGKGDLSGNTQIPGDSDVSDNTGTNAASSPPIEQTASPDKNASDNSQISPKDMADGMKIAAKIDMGRIKGLTSDSATPEERRKSINYIKDTLTDEEIAKALILMSKYKNSLK